MQFISIMTIDTVIEIVGAIIGLIYLYLEYKANFWLWPVGILMSLFYLVIFYHGKFYADAAVNLYYIVANFYGLALWGKHRIKHEQVIADELPIAHTPRKYVLPLSIAFAGLWLVIFLVLHRYTDSPVPVGDAFTTALSIVAMWMLAKKYLEQWLLWIAVDAVSTILYVWKGLYPTAVLYTIYTVVAVLGYFRWRKDLQSA